MWAQVIDMPVRVLFLRTGMVAQACRQAARAIRAADIQIEAGWKVKTAETSHLELLNVFGELEDQQVAAFLHGILGSEKTWETRNQGAQERSGAGNRLSTKCELLLAALSLFRLQESVP